MHKQYNLGCYYAEGIHGFSQDMDKVFELWHRAGELGCAESYHNIGTVYLNGDGTEKDMKKAVHYWKLAAVGGDEKARYNLGCFEEETGNIVRALNHHMIAVGFGHSHSLKQIREFYMNGYATKDDYAKALRAYQEYLDGIKSPQRDEAAAFNREKYRYY